jgi:hypothetical protein
MGGRKVFWMLFVDGGHAPVVKHESYDGAKHEAERLARSNKKPVYVLEVVAKCEATDVTWGFFR